MYNMISLGHNISSEVMYSKSVETVTYVSQDHGCKGAYYAAYMTVVCE